MAKIPSTGTDSEFQVVTAGIEAALGEFRAVTGAGRGVVGAVETVVLDVLAFAQIGAGVGSASDSLHGQLVTGLGKVVSFVETLGGAVETVLKDYQQLDTDIEKVFKALGMNGKEQTPGSTTPSGVLHTAQAADPAQPAQTHPAAPAATPAAHPQTGQDPLIDDRVVNSVMASEGAHGEQGGVDEVYGFRQSSHNGYDEIMAARAQYGQGSPEEHAVVARLLTRHADQAGAGDFSDPGIRAAIASSAHMRGTGGTRAILNSMVTGQIQSSARSVSPDNMAALQQLTPEQFQQQFHDARINYDQTVYGNTTTHQGGHTDTWWHRYGNGLTQRYDREQTLFNTISQGASAPGGGQ
ncbi:hypothetical protein [Catenulispora subtropica]|uniref:Uncharacterized protein n=1 Tax=Catenulispora subtropica TaxID=450798 RepID=A0ABN2SYU3_9ACTN